jgi:rubrerythrin
MKEKRSGENLVSMAQQETVASVADIFRRAQSLKRERAQMSYKELRKMLVDEYKGRAFPPVYNLTIPEQDARAPEEDWTAGLSIVLRGIQTENWQEVVDGVVLCLEQTEGYEAARGTSGSTDEWHDRTVGIRESLSKGVGKWMPPGLVSMGERDKK